MNYQQICLSSPRQWRNKIAVLTLKRPEKHNALNEQTLAELNHALITLAADSALHLVLLTAEGQHFCAGADLTWMQQQAQMSAEQNLADPNVLAELLNRFDRLPCPTLTLVQGSAFGGALRLIACSDLVIAEPHSQFCLSEVKLGLIPATISPYVTRAIGMRHMRRYALSAEMISAESALTLRLIHQISPCLQSASDTLINKLLANGPQALRQTKALLQAIAGKPITAELQQDTAQRIAQCRASAEAQEGIKAFFAKRPPAWRQ